MSDLDKVAEAIYGHIAKVVGRDDFKDMARYANEDPEGHKEILNLAQAAIDAMGWRPIEEYCGQETVLVHTPQLESRMTMAYRYKGQWCTIFNGEPFGRHVKSPKWFRPLPPAPKEEA